MLAPKYTSDEGSRKKKEKQTVHLISYKKIEDEIEKENNSPTASSTEENADVKNLKRKDKSHDTATHKKKGKYKINETTKTISAEEETYQKLLSPTKKEEGWVHGLLHDVSNCNRIADETGESLEDTDGLSGEKGVNDSNEGDGDDNDQYANTKKIVSDVDELNESKLNDQAEISVYETPL